MTKSAGIFCAVIHQENKCLSWRNKNIMPLFTSRVKYFGRIMKSRSTSLSTHHYKRKVKKRILLKICSGESPVFLICVFISRSFQNLSGQRLALGNQRFPFYVRLLNISRGELSVVTAGLMSRCL